MRVALVATEGVVGDECDAFRSVLALLPGAEIVTVAAAPGPVRGPGGPQIATAAYDDLVDVDLVVVPGGLGCERAAEDPALRAFLTRMEHTARFIAASSTGSVVLAAAGILHGAPAATHWLAGNLLHRYGSELDDRRLVVSGTVITCEGRISAVDAALALVDRIAGAAEVERIRATLLERGEPLLRTPPWWHRLRDRLGLARGEAPRPYDLAAGPPVTPLSVMIELVDDEELVQRLRRRHGSPRRS